MDTVQSFIDRYYPSAKKVEVEFHVPALFDLAQSALETGWGRTIVGNMMFGVKDTDGVNGNEQLLTTTEYHNSPSYKYPVILWVKQVKAGKLWKYRIKDWFRKYPTPYESFRDHAQFLLRNKRYRAAFEGSKSDYDFGRCVCAAGYATDPNYWDKIKSIMKTIETRL